MEKTLRMSLLFDFYGPLLTERQQDVYQMYFHEDLSLGEIAEQLNVSRQAIYDVLKRSAVLLEDYEVKLALVAKHQERSLAIEELDETLVELTIIASDTKSNLLQEKIREAQGKLKQIITES